MIRDKNRITQTQYKIIKFINKLLYASNTVHLLLFTQLNDYTMPYFMADKEKTDEQKEEKTTGKTNKTAKDENRIGNHTHHLPSCAKWC